MASALDPTRYPRASAYLSGLPNGLNSVPTALVRAEVFDILHQQNPQLAEEPDLPGPIKQALCGESEEWITEVTGNTLMLAARDRVFSTDDAFLEWGFTSSAQQFRKPLFKALMMLLSPMLVVLNASRRWGAFHQGSTLEVSPASKVDGRVVLTGTLRFPDNLMPELVLRRWGKAYEAAIDATRAREPTAVLRDFSATQGRFELSWNDG